MERKRIAIIGLGLIGGSMGKAFVQKGYEVVAMDNDPATAACGIELGAATKVTDDPVKAVREADIVFLAVPIGAITAALTAIAPYLSPGTVVSDVASVKSGVMEELGRLLPAGIEFVGGHPMAGTEQGGIAAANPLLFTDAFYVLTPGESCSQGAVEKVSSMVKELGAVPVIMDAVKHDRAVATLSHLPHFLAVALANSAAALELSQPGSLNLAAGSFRDGTRVAESSPVLWRDISLANRSMLLEALKTVRGELEELENALRACEGGRIEKAFAGAGQVRAAYHKHVKGKLAHLVELSVSLPNEPGTLGLITKALGEGNVNIANIEVLRVREAAPGGVILGFQGEDAAKRAMDILTSLNIRVEQG